MTDLKELLLQKEEDFNKISAIIQEITQKYNKDMAELEAEQMRIQGEYRLLSTLIEESNNTDIKETKTEE